ncbi:MFS transporter [Aliidongia dinghuensis]|uniref:MFS transporter n=1 Tax=Aliidongia dinghuensis TaxID=1867774 RepID=A0A8J2YYT3_9PROT|nr:MFS transporter [Aliidongia dinghuensis]GGF34794.1 MFS transporter [Aliidongia dinghuensis]
MNGDIRHSPLGAAARGLDGLNLFVANIQTGFGPFIAVFLTSMGWTQTAIGIALSIGTVTAMVSQVPAGAVVDAVQRKSMVALASVLAFAGSALMFALWPIPLSVYLAEILHGFSSCTLGPAIAALSLVIAGSSSLGVRLGRNARFASIGNGVGALLMGACGYYLPERFVFFLTAVLTVPAVGTLVPLARYERLVATEAAASEDAEPEPVRSARRKAIGQLLLDRRLVVFALCAALFTLGNAALLPLASSALTKRAASEANLLIAACIVLPQVIVALLSPTIGRLADRVGRRVIVMLAFAALAARAVLFAGITQPVLVVAIQAFDGVAGACFGVIVPLVTSDVAGRSGHFNLCLGLVGFAIGIGAAVSTVLGGWTADRFGEAWTFLGFGAISVVGAGLTWAAMPETRPGAG